MHVSSFASEQNRQRLAAAIIACASGLNSFSEPQEQQLVRQYQQGRLTIDEVVYSLEARRAGSLNRAGQKS